MGIPGNLFMVLLVVCGTTYAQAYTAPAGVRPASRRSGASILPGGRIVAPLGDEYVTGGGAFGIAVSPSGQAVVTANTGRATNSLTILEREKAGGKWDVRQVYAGRDPRLQFGEPEQKDPDSWKGVFMGLAFTAEHTFYVSEGNSGRVSQIDWNGDRRRFIDLNRGDYKDSYTGDLAADAARNVLYVLDQANFRVAVIDLRTRQIVASVRTGRLPFAMALSPDRKRLYVTNVGMFQYQAIPGVDAAKGKAKATGLPFPAFGFPSPEAAGGVQRTTEQGPVQVPGLGDPNVSESNSVCVIDVSTPAAPKLVTFVRTGLPFGDQSAGGSGPAGVLATATDVFVSNSGNDSITVIDPATNQVRGEIPIRIAGFEMLRGVMPVGLAFDSATGWLLVAEAGFNAVAVIDPAKKTVLGHIPAGWFPARVALHDRTVFVTNARGNGTGPNAYTRWRSREGNLSMFTLPQAADLPALTDTVMKANGFQPRITPPPPLPDAIRHVVIIVKENRTYDEVFGDIVTAGNGPAMGLPEIARLGSRGFVQGRGERLSLKDVNVSPNHHSMARRWAFSDNFYADSDVSVDGHHWLVGAYPNLWTETSLLAAYSDQKKDFRLGEAPGRLSFAATNSSVHPEDQVEGGTIWHHFDRHHITFYNFGEGFELAGNDESKDLEPTGARLLTNVPMPDPLYRNTSRTYPGFNMNIPDQFRADQFIREIQEKYVKPDAELPQVLFIHLPNDHMTGARPQDGYPYGESFMVDNDYALGRILEFLSGTKWWKEMAVFITEDDAQGGVDHIDAHRTVLLAAGPWIKRNYVSHANTSFPGLLKTVFRLLHLPPLNLFDATATDLSDLFTTEPDFTPYKLLDVDRRIFDPAAARQAPPGSPSVKMDRDDR